MDSPPETAGSADTMLAEATPSAGAPTVRTKLVLLLVIPSETVTQIVVTPALPRFGTILRVRFELVPLNVRSWDVAIAGFDESATSVRFAAGVSTSPMVKEATAF